MFTKPSHEIKSGSLTSNLAGRLSLIGGIALATALGLVAPASAQRSGSHGGDHGHGHGWIMPPRPRHGGTRPGAGAISPTISPSAYRVRHVPPGQTAPCPSGNLCASVWDPTTSDWKIFDLYYCNRYYLSYWQGSGQYNNAQTGGVRVYFYDQNGNTLRSFTATGVGSQNWDPVWSIRNC